MDQILMPIGIISLFFLAGQEGWGEKVGPPQVELAKESETYPPQLLTLPSLSRRVPAGVKLTGVVVESYSNAFPVDVLWGLANLGTRLVLLTDRDLPGLATGKNIKALLSPHGVEVAISICPEDSGPALGGIFSVGTGTLRDLELHAGEWAWSPDGRYLAFEGHAEGPLPFSIYDVKQNQYVFHHDFDVEYEMVTELKWDVGGRGLSFKCKFSGEDLPEEGWIVELEKGEWQLQRKKTPGK